MDIKQNRVATQINFEKNALVKGEKETSLTKILGTEECQNIIANCREFRERIYTPWNTLLMFIKQAINPDKSCKNIVTETVAKYILEGKEAPSNDTGPYAKTREHLPETTIIDLVNTLGATAVEDTPKGLKWRSKDLKEIDGTTFLMPDTKENQEVFPQHGRQEEGVGFPITRLAVIMSLSIGVVLNYAMGPYQGKGTGEHSLLREIFDSINPNDVILGDAYFPSYFLLCDLLERAQLPPHLNDT